MATAASLKFQISSTWDGSGVRQAREDIRALQNDLREIGNKVTARVKVEPSMVGFASKVREGARGITAEVRVDPNLTGFQQRLNEAVRTKNYHIKVSVVPDVRGLQQRLDAMAASRDLSIRVRVNYDRSGLAAVSGDADRATASLRGLSEQSNSVSISFRSLVANTAGLVGVATAAKVAVAGLATAAFAPLIGNVLQATKFIAAVPSVLAGVGLVAGTVKIGLTGLGDAFKAVGGTAEEFEESIAGLAPNAQEFMRVINGLKGSWDELTASVQNELFEGVGDSVQELADQHLPRLKEGFTGIADELNEGLLRQMDKLKDPAVGAAIDTLFSNVEKAVGPATDAVGDFAIGLGNIASAGSENLPGIAEDFADIAESFKEWTANSANAEKVKQWISEGWEALKGLSKDIANFAIDTLPSAIQKIEEFGQKIGAAFSKVTASDSFLRLQSVFDSLLSSAQAVWPAIKQIAASLAEAAGAVGVSVWLLLVSALEAVAGIASALVGPLQTLGSLMSENQGLVTAAVIAWLAFRTVPAILAAVTGATAALAARMTALGAGAAAAATGVRAAATATGALVAAGRFGAVAMGRFGSSIAAIGTHVPVIARMQSAFVTAAAGATRFGRTAGVASAAMTGLRSAGSGLVGALGGGFSAALIGAGVAIYAIASASQNAEARVAAFTGLSNTLASSQRELASALAETNGQFSGMSMDALVAQVDAVNESFRQLEATAPGAMDYLGSAITDLDDKWAHADLAERVGEANAKMAELGITSEDVGRKIAAGMDTLGPWVAEMMRLGAMTKEQAAALLELGYAAEQALNSDFSAIKITDGLREIAETADDAASDLESLKSVLEGLGIINVSAAEAMADFEAKIDEIAEAAAAGAGGLNEFSGAIDQTTGTLNLGEEAGRSLQTALIDVADDFQRVAASGGDTAAAMAGAEKTFATLATATNVPIEKIRELAAQFGYLPREVAIAMSVDGAGQVGADLANVALQMGKTPDTKSIKVDLPGGAPTAAALEDLGFTVEKIPGSKEVKVTANTSTAKTALDTLLLAAGQLELNPAELKVFLDTAEFTFKKTEVETIMSQLGAKQATPKVLADVSSALSDMKLTADELNNLDLTTASPEVIAIINDALASLATVNSELDTTDGKRPNPVVTADVGQALDATGQVITSLSQITDKNVTVTVTTVNAGASASNVQGMSVSYRGGIAGRWKGGIAPKGLPGHAAGYRLPTSGPGTSIRDGFLGLTSKGMPITRVDAGEWIINGRSSEKFDPALDALNRGNPMAAIVALQRHVGGGEKPRSVSGGSRRAPAVAGSAGGGDLNVNLTVEVKGDPAAIQAAGPNFVPAVTMALKQGVGMRAKVAS